MSAAATPRIAIPEMPAEAAYPRKNGEPVFDAPWQSRAFGMVVGLHTAGEFPWQAFKDKLIAHVAAGAPSECPPDSSPYYYQWVDAFCRLLDETGIVRAEELDARSHEFLDGTRQQVF
jgi:nitrile hydratase accessory protein